MIKVNEYYDGSVKSLGFENSDGTTTVGVMDAGEFEFGTSTDEYMTVTSGEMDVMLPGETDWKTYKAFDTFFVGKDQKFRVKAVAPAAYKCIYK